MHIRLGVQENNICKNVTVKSCNYFSIIFDNSHRLPLSFITMDEESAKEWVSALNHLKKQIVDLEPRIQNQLYPCFYSQIHLLKYFGTSCLVYWLKPFLYMRMVWGPIPRPVILPAVSPTARHRQDVSSKFETALHRRQPPKCSAPLLTRFGVVPRV